MAKKRRKLKKEVTKTITMFSMILVIVFGVMIFKTLDKFDYQESLDDVVITISNNSVSGCMVNITLGEISYYIAEVEAAGQETALIYNKNNPLEYWNLYFNENMTENSGYVTDIAKRSVITYCIRDNIYNLEMRLNGFELDDEIMAEMEYDAENAYYHLTDRQQECMGMTLDEYKRVYIKEKKSHEYMIYMARNDESATALESIVLKYDVGGYYYDSLINHYDYKVNEKLWENVRIGHVTVN